MENVTAQSEEQLTDNIHILMEELEVGDHVYPASLASFNHLEALNLAALYEAIDAVYGGC